MGKKSRRNKPPRARKGAPEEDRERDHDRFRSKATYNIDEATKVTLMDAVSKAHTDAMTERELELARDEREGRATREEVYAMTEFINLVVFPVHQKSGLEAGLRMARRWPRAKPHWRRLRRRVCEHCWKRKDLSEPRLWVCGGCGVARYCGEKCQAKDFSHHSKSCPLLARRWDGVGFIPEQLFKLRYHEDPDVLPSARARERIQDWIATNSKHPAHGFSLAEIYKVGTSGRK